jgi:hypothetical protein
MLRSPKCGPQRRSLTLLSPVNPFPQAAGSGGCKSSSCHGGYGAPHAIDYHLSATLERKRAIVPRQKRVTPPRAAQEKLLAKSDPTVCNRANKFACKFFPSTPATEQNCS